MSAEIIEETQMPDDLTDTGVELPAEMSFEGWLATARFVRMAERGWQWWLADLLIWAEDHGMRNRAAQVFADLGFKDHTLVNKESVGRRFPKSRRRDKLSFDHHATVAFEDEKIADMLLERAEQDNWSRDDLRFEMQRYRETTATPDNPAPRRHPGPQKRSRREFLEPEREVRNIQPTPEQEIDLLKLCQEAIDEFSGNFEKLAGDKHATPDRIMVAAAAAKEKLLSVIDACERLGCEPI